MKLNLIKLMACLFFGTLVACGNNNNQSEGTADSDDTVESSGFTPAPNSALSTGTDTTATDTVVKGHNSEPGEGNNISGTGVYNGSGKTGGG